jgi:dihydrofolate reductase
VSLDGYVEDRDGGLEWSRPDDELMAFHNEQARAYDTSLYGRGLYENMAGYWPAVRDDPAAGEADREFARVWCALPKVVFSTTLTEVGWNSRLVRGDLLGEVARLKAEPGGDMDLGGPRLAASFLRLDLVDEFRLFVHPVVLGGGTPLFPPLERGYGLELVDTRVFGSGVVYLAYRRPAG